ncbi:MAG TPA: zinc-dependent alcohol dehydrogenase [Urbifossiella sp.]|jgi:threonine dehydrogenase-like Zn-dependent dehydrogenase|nr:zinc-dependent alcohol dehydrogenase [Urbifossiella sp.]
MKAVCWQGKKKVGVETVPDPKILNPRDAILRITTTAICGSDLHLYDGFIPGMEAGDILGHEFMGEVVEVGPKVTNVKAGDRVAVPFNIACGKCFYCADQKWSLCDNTNPNAAVLEKAYGYSGGGLFGYSHLYGGYAGGQAEYVRVPMADVGLCKLPGGFTDEQLLFLTDVFPTGYMAAENCDIRPGDTIAVWGAGPVGLFAMKSAFLLGAGRVIAIDSVRGRLEKARRDCGAETIDRTRQNVLQALDAMTAGRGPDGCIDAVGMEAHGATALEHIYDRVKQGLMLESDRPAVLREAMMACRKGGTLSIPGVYGGLIDKLPFGAAFAKGLTFKMGQTHTHKYMRPLLNRIEKGEIDPSFVVSHRYALADAPTAYRDFLENKDEVIKCVLKP